MVSGNTFFFPWEVSLMEWLQGHIGGAGSSVISAFSMFGEETLIIVILGLLYFGYNKRIGKTLGMTALLGMCWNGMIKNVFVRRRPYMDHESIEIRRLVEPEADAMDIAAQGYSFPSGHSTNAATIYGGLAMQLKKRWTTLVAVLLILLVGFSRVVVGAHYPTDVLVGWLSGGIIYALISSLEKRVKDHRILHLILFLFMVPGVFFCQSHDYYTVLGLGIGFLLGTLIEERFVHFENTKNILRMALRVVGLLALYVVLGKLSKLPFSEELLTGSTKAALLIRTGRYACIGLVCFGLYPFVFGLTDRWFGQKK